MSMNRWLVLFENALGNQPLRDQHKAAHHAQLLELRYTIRIAMAVRDSDLEEFSGAAVAPNRWRQGAEST